MQLTVDRSAPVCTYKLSSPPVCTFKESGTDIVYKMTSTFGMTCTFGMSLQMGNRLGKSVLVRELGRLILVREMGRSQLMRYGLPMKMADRSGASSPMAGQRSETACAIPRG